jgi:hypothetical protein
MREFRKSLTSWFPTLAATKGAWFAAAVIILAGSTLLAAYRIGEPPWDGASHSYVLSEYPFNAANYLRWGYIESRLGPIENPGAARPAEGFSYRFSHGNITALIISFSYRLFGISEWSARLPVVALAILGAAMTGLLALRLTRSRAVALAALAFAALTPLYTFYARLPGPHMLATTFALLAFYSYWRWFESNDRRWLAALFFWLAVGAWTDWIAYFAVPPILLHFAIFRFRDLLRRWRVVGALITTPLLLFGSYISWAWLLSSRGFYQLRGQFLFRTGDATDSNDYVFTISEYLSVTTTAGWRWLTAPVIFLAAIWMLLFVRAILRRRVSPEDGLVGGLFVFALVHNLVFPNRVMNHEFILIWHALPAFAISAAIGLRAVARLFMDRSPALAITCVLLLLGLFIDQGLIQYRRAHAETTPAEALRYYTDLKLREIVPADGRYLALNELPSVINDAVSDRARDVLNQVADDSMLEQVRSPNHYNAILVSHGTPPSPDIVQELSVRYPRVVVGGHSIFVTDGRAISDQPIFVESFTQSLEEPVIFGDHIELLGYEIDPVVTRAPAPDHLLANYLSRTPGLFPENRTSVRIVLFWRKIHEQPDPYNLSARLIPLGGTEPVLTAAAYGTEDLLPTTAWPPGQIIRDEFTIRVPADAPDRRYGLWVGVNNASTALNPQTSDLRADAGNRVLVGQTDIRPMNEPTPARVGHLPEHELNTAIADDIILRGYTVSNSNTGLLVETFWERTGGSTDLSFTLVLDRPSGNGARAAIDVPPPRLWSPGSLYHAETLLPASMPNADYELQLEVIDEQGAGALFPITNVAWCATPNIRATLARIGVAGDDRPGNPRVTTESPLRLEFSLNAPSDVDIQIAWVGRSALEETPLEVHVVNRRWLLGSTRKSIAWLTTTRGVAGSAIVRLPRNLTSAGKNTVEISIPSRWPAGWRAPVATLLPFIEPMLADHPEPYRGWVELDMAQAWIDISPDRPHEELSVLPLRGLVSIETTVDQAISCYDVKTRATLNDALQAALTQQDWNKLEAADIAAYQAMTRRLLPEALTADLLRRIMNPANVVYMRNSEPLIRLIGSSMRPTGVADASGAAETEIVFFFELLAPMTDDLTIWLHGLPAEALLLTSGQQEATRAYFDHPPSVPTSRWQPGQIYVSVYRLPAPPEAYQLSVGFYRTEPFEILDGRGVIEPQSDTVGGER